MELRSAHNYKHKQQQLLALIELVIMPLQLMALNHHMHHYQNAKPIYQHAFGMEVQDAQVEDVQHIPVYKHFAELSQQMVYLVGQLLQVEALLLVWIKIVDMLQVH